MTISGQTSPQTQAPDMAKAALAYGEMGHDVVSLYAVVDGVCTCWRGELCLHPGKHPRTPRGLLDATSNLALIASQWGEWPDSNIGLRTGPSFVLDVDLPAGEANLLQLERQHGALPVTPEVHTGSGGRHIYFQGAEGITTSSGALPPNLDVRGWGGLVVAPPSLHASGERYRWDPTRHLRHTPLAVAPDWLLSLIRTRPAPAGATGTPWSDFLSRDCPEHVGRRNASLARLMGYLLAHSHKPEEARALALLWNERRCRPPLDEKEFNRTADSMIARHLRTTQGG